MKIDEIITVVNVALDACPQASERFFDNGDGTITDLDTSLMWEKKSGNTRSDESRPHAADHWYPFSGLCVSPTALQVSTDLPSNPLGAATATPTPLPSLCQEDSDCPDGLMCRVVDAQTFPAGGGMTIFQWVDQLNEASFAGHSDWRVPTIQELQSLIDYGAYGPAMDHRTWDGPGCGLFCTDATDPECSCASGPTWSATTSSTSTRIAWLVSFDLGDTRVNDKQISGAVRAVRNTRRSM